MSPRARPDTPLARACEARGLTQTAAAAIAGVGQSRWSEWENAAEPTWSWATWRKIARVLGLKPTVALFAEYLAAG